jgi:hypothetical protein
MKRDSLCRETRAAVDGCCYFALFADVETSCEVGGKFFDFAHEFAVF